MKTTIHSSVTASPTEHSAQQFPSLDYVSRPTVPTEQAAYYLNRRPQTLRGWACAESFPEGLRPVRLQGRLCWPVAGIRAALGMTK
jgi:hypothetical protein